MQDGSAEGGQSRVHVHRGRFVSMAKPNSLMPYRNDLPIINNHPRMRTVDEYPALWDKDDRRSDRCAFKQ